MVVEATTLRHRRERIVLHEVDDVGAALQQATRLWFETERDADAALVKSCRAVRRRGKLASGLLQVVDSRPRTAPAMGTVEIEPGAPGGSSSAEDIDQSTGVFPASRHVPGGLIHVVLDARLVEIAIGKTVESVRLEALFVEPTTKFPKASRTCQFDGREWGNQSPTGRRSWQDKASRTETACSNSPC